MRPPNEKWTVWSAVVLGILLAAFFVSVIRNRPTSTKETRTPPTVDADDPTRGPVDAVVTIIEFGDFQCPFCQLAQTPFEAALIKYPGKVRHVWKNFPLTDQHPEALDAAEAAHCSQEQGKFWEMHDALFARQGELTASLYTTVAQALNVNVEQFTTCMGDDRTLPAIQADVAQATAAGVDGVPAYFVNNKPLFVVPDGKNLEALIEASL